MLDREINTDIRKKIPFDMYEVSGQKVDTQKLFQYYTKSEKEELPKIEEVYKKSSYYLRLEIEAETDPERKKQMIIDGLSSDDIDKVRVCAQNLYNIPQNERWSSDKLIKAVRDGLNSGNIEKQIIFSRTTLYMSENEQEQLIDIALDLNNIEIIRNCINGTRNLNQSALFVSKFIKIIEDALDSGDTQKQDSYSDLIWHLEEDKRAKLLIKFENIIIDGLNSNDVNKHILSADKIHKISREKKDTSLEKLIEIIKNGLDSDDIEKQMIYAEMIEKIPEYLKENLLTKLETIIIDGLDSNETKKKILYAKMIMYAQDKSKYKLIEIALDSNDTEVIKICLEMIEEDKNFDQKYNIYKKLVKIIENGLDSDDIADRKKYASMIFNISDSNQRTKLFKLAKEKIGDRLIESPLYDKVEKDSKGKPILSKKGFEKSHSETTLLGSGIEENLIVRHINPESFLAWKRAYEMYDVWKRHFNYVPVEPIVKFRLNNEKNDKPQRKGLVDVFSGVLDCSLSYWFSIGGGFLDELEEKKKIISKVLRENYISHGHDDHFGNFCLRFERDEKGNIDFSKEPKIYVIDFDIANIKYQSDN